LGSEVGNWLATIPTWTGEALAQHRTGDVLLVRAGPIPVVRKRYVYPTARDHFRGVFRTTLLARSRVRREFDTLNRLADLGLNPELAVATLEIRRCGVLLDSYLVTRHWPAPDLAWIWEHAVDRRESIARALGAFLRRLHQHGYVDRDCHLRNLLCDERDHLVKIDCPRGSFHGQRRARRLGERDLRDLATDLRGRPDGELIEVVRSSYRAG
jgi:tRNA A-37 threonylcarbamoyl transferase component Bud32